MTIIPITGLRHHKLKEIEDCLIAPCEDGVTTKSFKGSICTVWLEDNPKAQLRRGEKLALRVDCKGCHIGYINELYKIQEWIDEAIAENNAVKVAEKRILFDSVYKVRKQLFDEYDNNFSKQSWLVPVYDLLYVNDSLPAGEKWLHFDKFSDLPNEEKKKWKLVCVSIGFEL